MQTYLFKDCVELLDIDPKVFRELIKKELGLQKGEQVSRADRRARYLTREQLELLAARRGRTLPDDDALRKPEQVPFTSYKLLLDRLERAEEVLHASEQMVSSVQEELTQVKERLTQVETQIEHLADAQERPDHRLAELEAQHRQQVAELEARYQRQIAELEAQLAHYRSGQRSLATPPATTKKKPQSRPKPLPKTLTSRSAFAALHNVPDSVVARACNSGKIAALSGRWLYKSRIIFRVLGERGQRDFYQLFHARPDFTQCKRCPHEIAPG